MALAHCSSHHPADDVPTRPSAASLLQSVIIFYLVTDFLKKIYPNRSPTSELRVSFKNRRPDDCHYSVRQLFLSGRTKMLSASNQFTESAFFSTCTTWFLVQFSNLWREKTCPRRWSFWCYRAHTWNTLASSAWWLIICLFLGDRLASGRRQTLQASGILRETRGKFFFCPNVVHSFNE